MPVKTWLAEENFTLAKINQSANPASLNGPMLLNEQCMHLVAFKASLFGSRPLLAH